MPRKRAIQLLGSPYSTPLQYSFEVLKNEKQILRLKDFLEEFKEWKEDVEPDPMRLVSGKEIFLVFYGEWYRAKLIENSDWDPLKSRRSPIPVYLIDKGISLSNRYLHPLVGLFTINIDSEKDLMSSMPLSVQKEMAHDVVSNWDLFVKLRPNFLSKYRYCSSWGAAEDSEISMKDIILNNSQDDGIKLHPLISNAMSNIMPSGAESRVKTKKIKIKQN
ncbi:unnamed protein product [Lepeophtheirus salmonis]|uniref:(salmon louse) hypothetical protein n=1 Tax=Lepeophtheirus salmonis TaxID=72036 RepID=A0A7R8CSJ4_LEPSM|nr:unnamed protein product [Lepeophtheirus salmonis]CAF2917791.1 unnamed protein product [Lepeophtheirus salmonis]